MKIFGMFPGQGSQVVGMGRELFETSELAREFFHKADNALGYKISELCFDGPLEKLTLTENAQPAILLVGLVAFYQSGAQLSVAAGHSLGEYAALVAASSIGFEDALRLVHKRGRYMQEAVPSGQGKMLAVMGPTEDEISSASRQVSAGIAEIANLNCPGQTVVAGNISGIDEFASLMSAKGAKIIPLNVSAPFHCSLMKPAADKLGRDLDAIEFANPKFPVYCNAEARMLTSGEDARAMLKKQVCATVRWTESVQKIIATEGPTLAIEFGAGGVLSKLLKRIDSKIKRLEAANQADILALKKELEQ